MVEREVAQRIFAKEFNDSTLNIDPGKQVDNNSVYTPNFLITPIGTKVNRVFVVGVVTEVDNIGTDNNIWRARIVDPTGAFVVYAGQYQPEASIFLSRPSKMAKFVSRSRSICSSKSLSDILKFGCLLMIGLSSLN